MKKIFTAVFAVLMFATAAQAQLNSNVQLTRRNAAVQQNVDVRTQPQPAIRPAAMPFAHKSNVVNTFPYYEGFENGMTGWTIIDADGDGFQFSAMQWANSAHGNYFAYSESYYSSFFSGMALTPDNWLVSSKIVVPENSNLKLSWAHITLDPEYAAEKYSVYVATGATVNDFLADASNLKYTHTCTPADSVWTSPDAIDLSAYAGDEIYIAFRHYDCTDQMALGIDDVIISEDGYPIVEIVGDNFIDMDSTLTLTTEIIRGTDLTYSWSSAIGTVTGSGPVVTIDYTVDGIDTVTLVVTAPGNLQYTVTYIVNVISCAAAELPYEEGFEAGRMMCWTLADLDESDVNWTIYGGGHSGNYCAGVTYTTDPADNWLISKAINIPQGMENVELSFYYMVRSAAYPEDFRVLVSVNGNNPQNFTNVVFADSAADNTYWKRASISLNAFAGNTIYIAFNHLSVDMFTLYIDDIYVGEPLPPSLAVSAPAEGIAGEPVSMNAVVTAFGTVVDQNIHWQMNDTTMLNGDSINFTWEDVATGDYEYVVSYYDNFGEDTVRGTIHITNCATPITEYPYERYFGSDDPCWSYDGWELTGSYVMSELLANTDTSVMVSPIFTVPAEPEGAYEVEFWMANIGTNHLKITLVPAADPTATLATLYDGDVNVGSSFMPFRFSLAGYYGQNVRFVFTHTGNVNDADNTLMGIVYMYIRPVSAPLVDITVPTDGRVGVPVDMTSYVASATTATYSWTINGGTPATATTQNVTATWSQAGTYDVIFTATNAAGSTSDTAQITVIDCSPITQFPVTQNFENGLGCWDMVSVEEGLADETYFGVYQVNGAHSGSSCFVMDPYNGDFFDRSQYLISQEINCGGVDRGVEFYVTLSNGPDAVPFEVRYSTTDNNISSFTNVARTSGGNFAQWTRFNAVIPAAAKFVAISYTGYQLQNYIFFDDVTLLAAAPELTGIESVGSVTVNVFPNPATTMVSVKAEGLRQVEMLDINGRVVLASTESDIDISGLANGVYMLRTITNDGVAVNRIVKQ